MKKVVDIDISKFDIKNLDKIFIESGGFTAKKVGQAIEILKDMTKERDCLKFFSFPADIMSTGTRGVIRHLVKNKLVDVIITTCGTLDHDISRSFKDYYQGDFRLDDTELHKKGIMRLGNIIFPNENHGIVVENFMRELLPALYKIKKEWNTRDLCWEIGRKLNNEDSVLYWAYKNNISVIIPGITDGAAGSQLWMFYQKHKDFKVNLIEDEQILSEFVFNAKKTGALIIGGGISKHHTIWWNQFRDGLNYAVQITTAPEWDGSLSGAQTREAISWGKINERAKHVTVEGDATVLLPIIVAALD